VIVLACGEFPDTLERPRETGAEKIARLERKIEQLERENE